MTQRRQWSLENLRIWNVFWGCQIHQQMDEGWNYWVFFIFLVTGRWNVGLLTLIWHWAQRGRQSCKFHTPAALYPQGNSSLPISVTGWVEHKASECRQKERVIWKLLKGHTGNRTRNLPACCVVLLPTAALQTTIYIKKVSLYRIRRNGGEV
jgi:hypothetical protein